MVTDLEDVDRWQEPSRHEGGLHRRLGVAGEKCREVAHAQEEHDRAVVDVALGEGRGRIGLARVEHLEGRRWPERQAVARAQPRRGHPREVRIGHQAVVRDVCERNAGMEDRADPEAVEHLDQPGDVVLVRVAEHEQIDPTREER
jgi:hypothetical protein